MAKLPMVIMINLPKDTTHEIAANPEKIFSDQKSTTVEEINKNSWLIKKKGRIIRGPGYILHKTKDEKNLVEYNLESKGKIDFGFTIKIRPGKSKETEVSVMPFSNKSKLLKSELDSAKWWSYFQYNVDMIMGLLANPLWKALETEEKIQRQEQGKK